MANSTGIVRSHDCPNLVSSHHWSQKQTLKSHNTFESNTSKKVTENCLLPDPRNWSRSDVCDWLDIMASKHNIKELKKERFLMNGKALCLMTMDMYLDRVPLGGKLLYRDFQIRLARAMYL